MSHFAAKIAGALLASVLTVAPAYAAGDAALDMNVAFNPSPPKQGPETITVTLLDKHHKPVKDADVTVATSMPTMSMGGPTLKATPSRVGFYVAKINLNFATQWKFQITAKACTQSLTRSYTQDVK